MRSKMRSEINVKLMGAKYESSVKDLSDDHLLYLYENIDRLNRNKRRQVKKELEIRRIRIETIEITQDHEEMIRRLSNG